MKFIDVHSHILPGIDDGSENWEQSIEMLRQAEQDGIAQVVCTPHVHSAKDFLHEKEWFSLLEEFKERAANARIAVDLQLGCEIYIQPDLQLHRPISTLAQNGRYFLVEFPMNMIPDFVADRFFKIIISGKTPVIAHPERNGQVIQRLQIAYDFVARGALLQMNAGSLLGMFGDTVQQTAELLLEADLIHLVASDAHDDQNRTQVLSKAYQKIVDRYGLERGTRLFSITPQKIVRGEPVTLQTPVSLEQVRLQNKKSPLNLRKWLNRMVQTK